MCVPVNAYDRIYCRDKIHQCTSERGFPDASELTLLLTLNCHFCGTYGPLNMGTFFGDTLYFIVMIDKARSAKHVSQDFKIKSV